METLRQIPDGSLDDIYFPGTNPVDFKGSNIKEESIDETTLERDNDIVVKNEVFEDDYLQPEYYLADYQNDYDIDENDEAQENVEKAVTKKIKCELCDYHGSSLKKHMQQVHEKVMSYVCTICNNDFTSEKYLKNHVGWGDVRWHHGGGMWFLLMRPIITAVTHSLFCVAGGSNVY